MHYRISDKDEIVAVVNVFDSLYVFILLITKCYPSKKGHIEKFWSKSGNNLSSLNNRIDK